MYHWYRSAMNRYSDLRTDAFGTCLSNKVHHILCDASVIECNESPAFVSSEGSLDLPLIRSCLPDFKGDSYEYFVECARSLSPVLRASFMHFIEFTPEEFHANYSSCLKWTSIPKALQHCFELIKTDEGAPTNSTRSVESLLLSTSILERSLGDVFLIKGRQCPSMLKDLLVTPQLKEIFGETVIQLLRIVMGPPISLNLRNVTWHGFPQPGEMTPRFALFMLHLIITLGHVLNEKGIAPEDIQHRPLLSFTHAHQLPFSHLDLETSSQSAVINLFRESSFVLRPMFPFWQRAVYLYSKSRYDECTQLLLPQLEHALRRVFAAVNRCPERVLTAENNVLFTTFDEILDHTMEDGATLNKLRGYVGDSHVTMLFDLLMYPEGPRVRDRMSHGECALLWTVDEDEDLEAYERLQKQWRLMANHVLSVAIAFCCLFLPDKSLIKSNEYLESVSALAGQYRSVFHPVALLRSELKETTRLLFEWRDIPRPSMTDMEISQAWDLGSGLYQSEETDLAVISAKSFMCNISRQMTEENLTAFLYPFSPIDDFSSAISLELQTLYRYKTEGKFGSDSDNQSCEAASNTERNKEEEIVGLLRRILAQMREISSQVTGSCALRYDQWVEKKLRSRQRNTYQRMLNTIPCLSTGLRLILTLNLAFLLKMADPSTWNTAQQLKDIKLLKSFQQYTENLKTYTNVDKNRWEEVEQSTLKLLEKYSSVSAT